MKVDIARAFDSVSWPFLLELLQFMGFPRQWCNWISVLLSSASTKVLVNGEPSRRICHGRGLRQGDPLAPMLFLLVMEVLNRMIRLADEKGLFAPLGTSVIRHRASFYADDVVIFIAPELQDARLIKAILQGFEAATGLATNLSKCTLTPIRCQGIDLQLVQEHLACPLSPFPIKYLGIPLSVHKLQKADIQPVIDKVADRLPTWKSGLLNSGGRLTLTKVTLNAIPIYISIALIMPPWAIKAMEKLMRAFLWCGSDVVSGGRCLVAWPKVCCPRDRGGLGLLDLRVFGYALRTRWEWLQRTDPIKNWSGLPASQERQVVGMVEASLSVHLGNGENALFWTDKWVDGRSIKQLAPNLFQAVPGKVARSRSVKDALHNRAWTRDIKGAMTWQITRECIQLWHRLQEVTLLGTTPDRFIWKRTSSGEHTVGSTYEAFFHGRTYMAGGKYIWKVKAPLKCKFYFWLALYGRCWTSERLHRHGLRDSDRCALCDQEAETVDHLFY